MLTVVTQIADYHTGARFPATGWRLVSATRIAGCQTRVASWLRLWVVLRRPQLSYSYSYGYLYYGGYVGYRVARRVVIHRARWH